ncbi:hypothetical protein [Streptomyces lavendulae]|uniref:hypothetical protein n=1 Tax=Streptomyces lavendulae TaxID=1914 RepID=UPI0024A03889|nr:hypothetical protein [Streptomyces lavendulae]GLW03607.1 hypothetical protein Slala05_72370 [Streptomyces lavendulae subsp. lavendulae]
MHPAELNDGFREPDADGDGDGRVEEAEFAAAFRDFFTARIDSTAGAGLPGRA